MKNRKIIIGLLALSVSFPACNNKQAGQHIQPEPKAYAVETLSPQTVDLETVYPAVLKGKDDVEIKPRVDGFIEKVYVDEGAAVRKGQALFRINSPSSEKDYEKAKADYNSAKLDVERMQPLAKKNIISNAQLEAYQHTLEAAEATLKQAKATLGWVTVTSPVNGVVGTIAYRIGSLVSSSSVLTTVANTSNIYAYFSMNEKELYNFLDKWDGNTKTEKIKNMPEIQFILSNGKTYGQKGKIETIAGMVDQSTGTVNVRAAFPNENGLLLSGSSGKVVVPEHLESALVVPQKATFSQQDKSIIYKVQGDSVVQKVIAVTTTPDGKKYVVTNGLKPGDKVVVNDITNLSNGAKIKIR